MRRSLFGSALVLPLLAFQASAQDIPRFSIEKICASAKALTSEDTTPVETCVRDETAAHQQLHATWATSSSQHRETCVAETQIGGSPSYVDVLTCLQMYQTGAGSVPPRRQR